MPISAGENWTSGVLYRQYNYVHNIYHDVGDFDSWFI